MGSEDCTMFFVCTLLVQAACWNISSCAMLKFVVVVGVGLGIMHSTAT